jgi:hypothetical protein
LSASFEAPAGGLDCGPPQQGALTGTGRTFNQYAIAEFGQKRQKRGEIGLARLAADAEPCPQRQIGDLELATERRCLNREPDDLDPVELDAERLEIVGLVALGGLLGAVDQLVDAGRGLLNDRFDVRDCPEDLSDAVGKAGELGEELGVALDLVVRQLRRDLAQAGREGFRRLR